MPDKNVLVDKIAVIFSTVFADKYADEECGWNLHGMVDGKLRRFPRTGTVANETDVENV